MNEIIRFRTDPRLDMFLHFRIGLDRLCLRITIEVQIVPQQYSVVWRLLEIKLLYSKHIILAGKWRKTRILSNKIKSKV